MNNSVYGKTIENLRKRVKVRLADNAKDYKNEWLGQVLMMSSITRSLNIVAILTKIKDRK